VFTIYKLNTFCTYVSAHYFIINYQFLIFKYRVNVDYGKKYLRNGMCNTVDVTGG